mmetsp:Transcript_119643/g.345871  ORF Transcript_119643/g.345871 Transcript_119643/m.345871 type:complete len:233 (+) Transcript_119643:90-788(+)
MYCCWSAESEQVGHLTETMEVPFDGRFQDGLEHCTMDKGLPVLVDGPTEPKTTYLSSELAEPFEVTLKKATPTTPFGWRVDFLDKEALFVCSLVADPATVVSRYNSSAPPEARIQEGDFIVSVNRTVRDSMAMASMLKEHPTVEVLIQRPLKFRIKLDKHGESIGLDLKFGLSGNSLLVEGIREGAVRSRARQMRVGDRIVSVCGVTGNSSQLLKAMQEHDPLQIDCVRLWG